jgi:uncharacterized cupredoxin-like copper-binding protein
MPCPGPIDAVVLWQPGHAQHEIDVAPEVGGAAEVWDMERSDLNLSAILITLAAAALYGGLAKDGGLSMGHIHTSVAAGEPADPKSPARVVKIKLQYDDGGGATFNPAEIEVARHERINFVITNESEFDHDCILDTFENNARHVFEQEAHPDLDHDHDYANAKRISTEQTAKLFWRFTKVGTFEFSCLLPGHLDAGVKGLIHVVDERHSAAGSAEFW